MYPLTMFCSIKTVIDIYSTNIHYCLCLIKNPYLINLHAKNVVVMLFIVFSCPKHLKKKIQDTHDDEDDDGH